MYANRQCDSMCQHGITPKCVSTGAQFENMLKLPTLPLSFKCYYFEMCLAHSLHQIIQESF